MSGAFFAPHALTGGAGYKANPTYDKVLRKHSAFYRRHSAASNALEDDRRRSSAGYDMADHVAEANRNVNTATDTQDGTARVDGGSAAAGHAESDTARRGSVINATSGAATANERRGSVVVGSSAGRRESIFGLESTRGHIDAEGAADGTGGRRMSTSLAQDLWGKLKDRRGSHA